MDSEQQQSKRSFVESPLDSENSYEQVINNNKRMRRNENGQNSSSSSSPSSSRMTINPKYLKEEFLENLREKFQMFCENKPKTSAPQVPHLSTNKSGQSDLTSRFIYSSPFVHCVLPELIQQDDSLDNLQGELQELNFSEKNNDLYNFHQSSDLKHAQGPRIEALRNLFYKDILQWMKKVTGIELTNNVDLFCSIYEYTDVLLCHDDELEGRRIAFILYLVPPWSKNDGGSLDLFTTNDLVHPVKVEKSIVPAWNQFTFFEVSPKSFHQVSEILSKEKTRLSVSGWFHGPKIHRPAAHPPNRASLLPCLMLETDKLYDWINSSYLGLEVQAEIREKFESDSEIQLQDFLKPEKYEELNLAFQNSQVEWIHSGPANRRNIYFSNEDTLPDVIRECLQLLRSEMMFLFLSNLTGLKLHHEAALSDDDEEDCADSKEKEQKRPHRKLTDVRNDKLSAAGISREHNAVQEQEQACSDSKPSECENRGSPQENSNEACSVKMGRVSPAKSEEGSHPEVNSTTPEKDSDNHQPIENDKITAPESSVGSSSSNCQACCSYDVRLWRHGCYTLLQDTDADMADFALDAVLFFGCESWQPDYGGYVSYIVKGEDEELLTVNPSNNCLGLVYRDKETLRFIKHINDQITQMPHQRFFDISFVYHE